MNTTETLTWTCSSATSRRRTTASFRTESRRDASAASTLIYGSEDSVLTDAAFTTEHAHALGGVLVVLMEVFDVRRARTRRRRRASTSIVGPPLVARTPSTRPPSGERNATRATASGHSARGGPLSQRAGHRASGVLSTHVAVRRDAASSGPPPWRVGFKPRADVHQERRVARSNRHDGTR
jgi:hypothetical protein